MDDEQDKFVIWDTPSLDMDFEFFMRMYSSVEAIVSVYDISRSLSFDTAKFELQQLKRALGWPEEFTRVLVGSKADLPRRMVEHQVNCECLSCLRLTIVKYCINWTLGVQNCTPN